jgi:hypothetical protein
MLGEIKIEYIPNILQKSASKNSSLKIRKIDFKMVFAKLLNSILKSIFLVFGEEFLGEVFCKNIGNVFNSGVQRTQNTNVFWVRNTGIHFVFRVPSVRNTLCSVFHVFGTHLCSVFLCSEHIEHNVFPLML